jgi:parallel beta-helix repeat protein
MLRKTKGQAALTLGAAALAAVPSAQAATFTVTNLNDNGAGSLRQAILDANGAAGADVVDFQAGLTGTITLTTGQLSIDDSVDIQGPGAAVLTVSGNNASRVFYLYNGSATIDVTISGLTITGGSDTIGAGVVDFDENLTLDSVVITGNTASGDGGGLWADGFSMTLTIQDSTISGNTAGSDGGGIYVEDTGGPLTIQNTVITGNDAADDGGGIYFYDPDTSLTIVDSTISGNTAGDLGGGIYLYDTDGGSHLINRSTISGNSAAAGGGLFLYGPDNPFAIENSTISGNQATAGDGGGIFLYSFYGSFDIRHTTIAGNSATGSGGGMFTQTGPVGFTNSIAGDNTAGTDNDLATAVDGSFDAAYSLVEDPGKANITDNGGNIFNQDAQLGALANNGGPTQTQKPASSSLVVNAGDPAFVPPPSTDQRGLARVVNGRIDMGAVEINPGTIQLTFSSTSAAENAGTVMVTATRTGGSDGAVSVTVNTADGTAVAPGDYTAVIASLLNWADGDTAAKSLNITIANDTLDEPDETVTVTISNATGGAVLGAPVSATITIQDDDVPAPRPVEVPTVGDVGRVLLTALLSLSGLFLLRRKRGLAAPVLLLTLLAADANAATPAAAAREAKAVTLTQVTRGAQAVTIKLSDGTTLQVPVNAVEVVDRRTPKGRRSGALPTVQGLSTGQPLVVKVRRNPDGSIKKVKLQVFESLDRAKAALQRDPK